MNLAKKYYIDENGNMIGYTRYHKSDKTEVVANPFHAKLKITGIGWLRNGICIGLQDENGKTYNMNDVMFKEFIKQNELFLEGDWNFYQQGTAFSIGL